MTCSYFARKRHATTSQHLQEDEIPDWAFVRTDHHNCTRNHCRCAEASMSLHDIDPTSTERIWQKSGCLPPLRAVAWSSHLTSVWGRVKSGLSQSPLNGRPGSQRRDRPYRMTQQQYQQGQQHERRLALLYDVDLNRPLPPLPTTASPTRRKRSNERQSSAGSPSSSSSSERRRRRKGRGAGGGALQSQPDRMSRSSAEASELDQLLEPPEVLVNEFFGRGVRQRAPIPDWKQHSSQHHHDHNYDYLRVQNLDPTHDIRHLMNHASQRRLCLQPSLFPHDRELLEEAGNRNSSNINRFRNSRWQDHVSQVQTMTEGSNGRLGTRISALDPARNRAVHVATPSSSRFLRRSSAPEPSSQQQTTMFPMSSFSPMRETQTDNNVHDALHCESVSPMPQIMLEREAMLKHPVMSSLEHSVSMPSLFPPPVSFSLPFAIAPWSAGRVVHNGWSAGRRRTVTTTAIANRHSHDTSQQQPFSPKNTSMPNLTAPHPLSRQLFYPPDQEAVEGESGHLDSLSSKLSTTEVSGPRQPPPPLRILVPPPTPPPNPQSPESVYFSADHDSDDPMHSTSSSTAMTPVAPTFTLIPPLSLPSPLVTMPGITETEAAPGASIPWSSWHYAEQRLPFVPPEMEREFPIPNMVLTDSPISFSVSLAQSPLDRPLTEPNDIAVLEGGTIFPPTGGSDGAIGGEELAVPSIPQEGQQQRRVSPTSSRAENRLHPSPTSTAPLSPVKQPLQRQHQQQSVTDRPRRTSLQQQLLVRQIQLRLLGMSLSQLQSPPSPPSSHPETSILGSPLLFRSAPNFQQQQSQSQPLSHSLQQQQHQLGLGPGQQRALESVPSNAHRRLSEGQVRARRHVQFAPFRSPETIEDSATTTTNAAAGGSSSPLSRIPPLSPRRPRARSSPPPSVWPSSRERVWFAESRAAASSASLEVATTTAPARAIAPSLYPGLPGHRSLPSSPSYQIGSTVTTTTAYSANASAYRSPYQSPLNSPVAVTTSSPFSSTGRPGSSTLLLSPVHLPMPPPAAAMSTSLRNLSPGSFFSEQSSTASPPSPSSLAPSVSGRRHRSQTIHDPYRHQLRQQARAF